MFVLRNLDKLYSRNTVNTFPTIWTTVGNKRYGKCSRRQQEGKVYVKVKNMKINPNTSKYPNVSEQNNVMD